MACEAVFSQDWSDIPVVFHFLRETDCWKNDREQTVLGGTRKKFDNDDDADAAGVVLPGAFLRELRTPSPTKGRRNMVAPSNSTSTNTNSFQNSSASRYSPGNSMSSNNNNSISVDVNLTQKPAVRRENSSSTPGSKMRIIDMKPRSMGKM